MAGFSSFIDGVVKGAETRQRWDDRKRRQKHEDEDREWTRYEREQQKEADQYTAYQRSRQRKLDQREDNYYDREQAALADARSAAEGGGTRRSVPRSSSSQETGTTSDPADAGSRRGSETASPSVSTQSTPAASPAPRREATRAEGGGLSLPAGERPARRSLAPARPEGAPDLAFSPTAGPSITSNAPRMPTAPTPDTSVPTFDAKDRGQPVPVPRNRRAESPRTPPAAPQAPAATDTAPPVQQPPVRNGRFMQMVQATGNPEFQRYAQLGDQMEAALASNRDPETGEALTDDKRVELAIALENLEARFAQFVPQAQIMPAVAQQRQSNETAARAVAAAQNRPQPAAPAAPGPAPAPPRAASPSAPPAPPQADAAVPRQTRRTLPLSMGQPVPAQPPQQPTAPTATPSPASVAATGNPDALDAAGAAAPDVTPAVEDAAAVTAETARSMPVSTQSPAQLEKTRARAGTAFIDRYAKSGAPKMVQFYLSEGKPEKAAAYQEFIERQDTKTAMKHWADAVFAASVGDDRGFVDSLTRAYNSRGYFDDGYEAVPEKSGITRDEAGNVTGGQITYVDTQTGKELVQEIDSQDDLYTLGAKLLSPENVFEHGWSRIEAAQERRAKLEDALMRQRLKLPTSERQQLEEAMDLLADADTSFSMMSVDEQIAAALDYMSRFDSSGNLRAAPGGAPTGGGFTVME